MGKVDEQKLALRIAATLLVGHGEVSLEDIKSLPFLGRDFNVRIIADSLLTMYDAELISKKIPSSSFLRWEEVIRLKSKEFRVAETI